MTDTTEEIASTAGTTAAGDPAARSRVRRSLRWVMVGTLLVAAGAGGWGLVRYHAKRLAEVHPGVLYRLGQPTEWGLSYLVRQRGVRTVLSLQAHEVRLRPGLYEFHRQPQGELESKFTRALGAEFIQWPMGHEACWPFPTPWQFEAFFQLMDEPAHHPVAVHCAGGKHRTGSMVALFRLEYDRWPVERVLAEMYSYGFGDPQPTQELNLRTYMPRPWPEAAEWTALAGALGASDGEPDADYAALLRRLRGSRQEARVEEQLERYLDADAPFAASLAQRLVEERDDALAARAVALAGRRLAAMEAAAHEWSMSAALVADFGTVGDQQRLLAMLEGEPKTGRPSARYVAVVRGVTNRYTRNRVAYLQPLLEDLRVRPELEAVGTRFCDTAVARLGVMLDENLPLVDGPTVVLSWEEGLRRARAWFAGHAAEAQVGPLVLPTGQTVVRANEEPFPDLIRRYRR